ncbi:MAG: hypothetical protein KDD02_05535 [Phaeodactylibacter sp.]|nr:hypothetical protein [Phaeodactylibacter sp.]MCB9303550.1 hypothetical protein [Lewinellaceae bacterium]
MDCKQGTIHISQQISNLLAIISADAYARPLPVFNGSTIGQHFRHIFDFYDCLFRALGGKEVDYAARKRNALIEEDPDYARSLFIQLEEMVLGLDEEGAIRVRADFSAHPEAYRPLVASTIGRELMFAYDHALHHLALIKIGLREALPGLYLDEHLGVAPSTLKHRPGGQAAKPS